MFWPITLIDVGFFYMPTRPVGNSGSDKPASVGQPQAPESAGARPERVDDSSRFEICPPSGTCKRWWNVATSIWRGPEPAAAQIPEFNPPGTGDVIARQEEAEAAANAMKPGQPVAVRSTDNMSKSTFLGEVADALSISTGAVQIEMNVMRTGFEEALRWAIANKVEQMDGGPAADVIEADIRKSGLPAIDWLDQWLESRGYVAVIVCHEAGGRVPQFGKQLLGRERIYSIIEVHYASEGVDLNAVFPKGTVVEHYVGMLPRGELSAYVRRFQAANPNYMNPPSEEAIEDLYRMTGGWLKAVNAVLEQAFNPSYAGSLAGFPINLSGEIIDRALKNLDTATLNGLFEKLDALFLVVGSDARGVLFRLANGERLKVGEVSEDIVAPLMRMGFLHPGDDGTLQISGSLLAYAVTVPPWARVDGFSGEHEALVKRIALAGEGGIPTDGITPDDIRIVTATGCIGEQGGRLKVVDPYWSGDIERYYSERNVATPAAIPVPQPSQFSGDTDTEELLRRLSRQSGFPILNAAILPPLTTPAIQHGKYDWTEIFSPVRIPNQWRWGEGGIIIQSDWELKAPPKPTVFPQEQPVMPSILESERSLLNGAAAELLITGAGRTLPSIFVSEGTGGLRLAEASGRLGAIGMALGLFDAGIRKYAEKGCIGLTTPECIVQSTNGGVKDMMDGLVIPLMDDLCRRGKGSGRCREEPSM